MFVFQSNFKDNNKFKNNIKILFLNYSKSLKTFFSIIFTDWFHIGYYIEYIDRIRSYRTNISKAITNWKTISKFYFLNHSKLSKIFFLYQFHWLISYGILYWIHRSNVIISNEYFEGNSKFRDNIKIKFLTLFQVNKKYFSLDRFYDCIGQIFS